MFKTKEDIEEDFRRFCIENIQKDRQKKIMHLDHKQSKESPKGAFYFYMFVLMVVLLPPTIAFTAINIIGLFLITFFSSINFYEGWITEETVHAWTEGQ